MNILIDTPKCKLCGNMNDLKRCGKCKIAYYCCSNHQRIDWPVHKIHCYNPIQGNSYRQNIVSPWTEDDASYQNTVHSQILNSHVEKVGQSIMLNNSTNTIPGINLGSDSLTSNQSILDLDRFEQSEGRNEILCRNIITDLNLYGLSVVDDFLGLDYGLQILNEVHKMYAAGHFQDGQLASNSMTKTDMRTIRGDKITWVKGTEEGCLSIGYLVNQIDAIICLANTMQDNGKVGKYAIKERTKAMIACYPGSGSHYVMHVDNPNRDGRVITAIYYLNPNWDTKRSGGVLRIFPESSGSVADIEPKFDRIIFFWSDRRNPHEVQPAHRTRYAITVWYFDANEREEALNRCRQFNSI